MSLAPLHQGERAARDTRRELGIPLDSPLQDLLVLAEDRLGLPVLIDRFEQAEVAGVLLKRADGEHFIAVNADPAFGSPRQRFTLAHELGHVRLGHQPRVDLAVDVFEGGRDEQEIGANYFAAELIAPRQSVEAWLEEHGLIERPGQPATVARFGLAFGLSFKAASYRFQRAGVISQPVAEGLARETGRHAAELARRYADYRLMDSIEELWRTKAYPRPPREVRRRATAAREAGLLDEREFALIVPPTREDDYGFAAWGE